MIYETDTYLEPYSKAIKGRHERLLIRKGEIAGYGKRLTDAINNHLFYGVHREGDRWMFREWAPNATSIYVVGDFNNWEISPGYRMTNKGGGVWELMLPKKAVKHGDLFRLHIYWNGGDGERLPSYATRCVQDSRTHQFSAQVWAPSRSYRWKNPRVPKVENPLIYETHIGMASEEPVVATFKDFTKNVLPRIAKLGYNTVQIMALQEHPYYGSFGYQVSNFFALSSRFGTPEEFKELVDKAHKLGLAVIMDIVHSHAVKNELEGLSNFDGTKTLYFHAGDKGDHPAWGTRCFDYGKDETLYFLLSNCKYWMEEYNLDGFRFDGITSMLYWDHGLGRAFGGYEDYFNANVDVDTYFGGDKRVEAHNMLAEMGLWNPTNSIWPRCTLLEEDAEDFAFNYTDVSEVLTEYRAKFITGQLDIDAEWDNFQNKMKKLGIEEMQKAVQRAYDAYLGK